VSDPSDPVPAGGLSTRAIVLAILATGLIVALTLVLIDLNRVSRCESYGERVTAFYERQANVERSRVGNGEISPVAFTEALLMEAGYPPPGCQIP
jgi:hypothetical protein